MSDFQNMTLEEDQPSGTDAVDPRAETTEADNPKTTLDDSSDENPEIEQLRSQISELTAGQKTLTEFIKSFAPETKAADAPDPNAPVEFPDDFETYSQAEVAKFTEKSILARVNTRLDQFTAEMGKIQGDFQQNTAQQAITTMKTGTKPDGSLKYPDFDSWGSEMASAIESAPGLGKNLTRVYNLVRMENPAKAAKLDKKFTPATAANATPGTKNAPGTNPVSLRPTSGTEETKPAVRTLQEAGKVAWAAQERELAATLKAMEDD